MHLLPWDAEAARRISQKLVHFSGGQCAVARKQNVKVVMGMFVDTVEQLGKGADVA